MRIIPAIDLLGGACVRLRQGAYDAATVYGDDPAAVAEVFAAAGARLIHVVDLDGARTGRPAQANLVRSLAAGPVPLEVGGGIRTMDDIAGYLEQGVARVVLGSAAVKNPALLKEALARYGPRIVLGVDARRGKVAVQGWTETTDRDVLDLVRESAAGGLAEVIYTDIGRDGMMTGPDLDGLRRLVREGGLKVIASGGVSSIADLRAVAEAGAAGAIVGKAIYDGRIDLGAAIQSLEDQD